MLKLDGAAEVEEPLPELAAAAPVLLAADPEFETVTPKPVDEPTADPEAPDLVVADTVRVVDALLYCQSEPHNARGKDALTRRHWRRSNQPMIGWKT